MSDPIESVVTEPVVETPPVEPTVETPDPAAEVAKWKALSRKNEERAKENEAAAKRLAEIEEANKSETEKLQARAEAAEKALAEREAKETLAALAAEVAKEKKVPAEILRGATREELEAHADLYLSTLPTVPAAPSADGLGAVGAPIGGADDQITREELASMSQKEIAAALEEGRLKKLMGAKTN